VEDRTRTVRDAFADEKDKLLPLPAHPFPGHERVVVEVGKTLYPRFDLNDYSLPHDRTQRTLVVLADLETVRIVEGNDIVSKHARSWDLAKAAPSSKVFLRIVAEQGVNLGSTTARLLQLLDAVGPKRSIGASPPGELNTQSHRVAPVRVDPRGPQARRPLGL
jgi:hypothetical protein